MVRHPILNYQQEMEERGLVVLKDIPNVLINKETFTFPGIIVCVNQQGLFKVEYDMRPLEFYQHDIAVLLPRHMVSVLAASQDSTTTIVMVSTSLFAEIKRDLPDIYRHSMEYHWSPHFHLSNRQYACIEGLLQVLENIGNTVGTVNWEIVKQTIGVMALLLKEYRKENGCLSHQPTNREVLFTRFMKR